MFSGSILRYVALAVRRDRIIQLMLVMMGLCAALSAFFGNAVTVEKQQFSIAFIATALRMVAVMGLIVFISFFTRRAFESKEIDYLLATPLTRFKLMASLAISYMLLAFILSVIISLAVLGLSLKITPGFWLWSGSVAVELMITSVAALFFATALKSATVSTLCSFGFYTLSRMMGLVLGIIQLKMDIITVADKVMTTVVNVISIIIPRFDLMAQSAWLVYGQANGLDIWILPVQAVVFCSLFFVCAFFDFRRSQF